MKTNTILSVLCEDGLTRISYPAYRVPGCFFVVREVGAKDFAVSDPNTGACIAHCKYFQTACRFANMLHDLICERLPEYSKASLEESKQILMDAQLGSFYHLRLCKPGQFENAYFEQQARNAQLSQELAAHFQHQLDSAR
jgi:hypothetical protein